MLFVDGKQCEGAGFDVLVVYLGKTSTRAISFDDALMLGNASSRKLNIIVLAIRKLHLHAVVSVVNVLPVHYRHHRRTVPHSHAAFF